MTKRTGLGLIAAIAAVAGLITMVSVVSAAVSSLGIESATVAPSGTVTVNLTADAVADDGTADGTANDGIGAFAVRVVYDKALLSGATTCASGTDAQWEIKVCNAAYDDPNTVAVEDNIVYFTGGASNGAVGTGINLGSITFTAGATEGVANLDVQIDTLTDPPGTDVVLTATDGSITIQTPATPTPSPTPSPSPTLAPTASPTATPASLPQTGGTESDGSTSLVWVLGFFGLAILAGGVWAVSRTRRHTA